MIVGGWCQGCHVPVCWITHIICTPVILRVTRPYSLSLSTSQHSRLRALNPGRYQLLHQIVCSILDLVIRANTFFLLQVWLFWELPEDFTMSRTVGIELVMICLAKWKVNTNVTISSSPSLIFAQAPPVQARSLGYTQPCEDSRTAKNSVRSVISAG